MSDNSVKTVHHARLEELRSFNLPFTLPANSSLNQLYSVNATASVPAPSGIYNKYPTMGYLAVGIYPLINNQPAKHRAIDGSLFKGIPWIVRADNDDLPNVASVSGEPVQGDYGIRYVPSVDTTIGDVTYQTGYIYYLLKKLNLDAVAPEMNIITVSNGTVSSETAFALVSDDLVSPLPVDLSNSVVNQVTGEHVSVQCLVDLALTTNDITELLAVCTHLFGNTDDAVITELGLVTAFNKGTIDEPIVTHAQIAHFIGTNIPLQGSPTSINQTFAVGTAMPLPATI